MRSLLQFTALAALFVFRALAQQPASGQAAPPGTITADPRDVGPRQSSTCSVLFTVVHYEGHLLAFGQMSDAQQKWWTKKGRKKYKQACLDTSAPQYLIVWGSQMESHAGVWFRYQPGTTSVSTMSGTVTDEQGNRSSVNGTATTTTAGPLETVPTVRTVSRVHLYVFTWRSGKLDGPMWMNSRTGEGWGQRGWSQTHPASQQLLDDALKFITNQNSVSDKQKP